MTTSPYDTLPTGKQALAPTSGESIEEKPNPITNPYGGYEEISLEEAARLATPVISQSQDSGSSPAANRNSGDPGSAKPAASQPASAPDTAMKKIQSAASARTDTQFGDVNITGNAGSADTASGSASLSNTGNSGSSGAASSSASLSAESLLDAELHYDNIRLRNRRRTWNYTLPFDETLLVPDTMPDMIQILFSEGRVTPSQPGKTHYSSSDTYSGEILLFTVYRPDGGEGTPVDVVRSTITFETSACWGTSSSQNTSPSQADSDRIYYATVCLKEVEPSRLNERKFQVRGKLCIAVTEIQKTELHVLRDSSDKNLILKQEKKEAADLIFETEEFADIEQEIAVEEDQPQPVRILKESFTITETHRQISSGKLIINGLSAGPDPVSGRGRRKRESALLPEGKDGIHPVHPTAKSTEQRSYQSGFQWRRTQVNYRKSGYLPAGRTSADPDPRVRIQADPGGLRRLPQRKIHPFRSEGRGSFLSHRCAFRGNFSTRSGEPDTAGSASREADLRSILPGNISVHPEHGRIVIEGSVPVRILSLDENGRAFVIKSEVPLRGALNTSASPEALQEADLFTCSAIKDFWIDTINSRQIEINVNAIIEVWISETREFTTLEHFTARGEDPQQPAMAIYITSAGDSLWNVAKHYQCDADALVQLNQIDGDAPLAEGAKLLIVR